MGGKINRWLPMNDLQNLIAGRCEAKTNLPSTRLNSTLVEAITGTRMGAFA